MLISTTLRTKVCGHSRNKWLSSQEAELNSVFINGRVVLWQRLGAQN